MEIEHRFVETNGIRMHVAEAGDGPLVILCHGFPESWYSWRHQLVVLAEAGFHAVAPDQRGYGQTDRPDAIDQYTLFHLVGDMVGLLDALGAETAVIAGHDWGAPVAWHAALLRPDRFRGVIGLSVPYHLRRAARPTTVMPRTEDAIFYQLYFQEPGVAEAEFERDPRATIRSMLFWGSGDAPRGGRTEPPVSVVPSTGTTEPRASGYSPPAPVPAAGTTEPRASRSSPPAPVPSTRPPLPMVPRGGGFLRGGAGPATLPAWLTEADVDFYAGEFTRSGFRGGLNWYRNIDRNWELMAPWADANVTVPALYVAGDRDLVLAFRGMDKLLPTLKQFIPNLRRTIILPGCGHWTQQERPADVNAAMLEFLGTL